MSRCACEVIAEPGAVHIMGEITTTAEVDYEDCVRDVIRRIGYTKEEYGFTDSCCVTCPLHKQSPDIPLFPGSPCAGETAQRASLLGHIP